MSSENATVAEQEYLEIMFWLEEAGLPMTGANIARAMQLSPPTVHEMIGRLIDDGYVERNADKSLSFTESGPRARQLHRPPPPDDRALPHRRPRHPLGRGPRGGGADRARDVAGAGGADAGGDRRRHHLPPRPPDRRGHPRAGLAAGRRRGRRRRRRPALRERGRGAAALPEGGGTRPGPGGQGRDLRRRAASSIASADGNHEVSRSVAETVSVRADPAPPPRAAIPEQLVLSSDRYGR